MVSLNDNVKESWKQPSQKEKDSEILSSNDNEGEETSYKLSETLLHDLNNLKSELISDYENQEVTSKMFTKVVEIFTRNNNMELHAKLDQIIKANDSLKTEMQSQRTLLQQFMGKTKVSLNSLVEKVCDMAGQDEVSGQIFNNLLPLTTKEQVDELEEKISVDLEYRRKLVRKLSTYGGVTEVKTIRNIAKCFFTDLLLTEFSWLGTGTKNKFNQYKFIFAAIVDAVRERFPSYTDTEGSNFFKNYLKHARFRLGKTLDEAVDGDVTMDENFTKS